MKISVLTNFISGFFLNLIIKMANLVVDVLQFGFDGFINFALNVIGFFPDGPALPPLEATPTGAIFQEFLIALNWFFPVDFLIAIIGWLSTGYILFLFVAPLARLFKLVT